MEPAKEAMMAIPNYRATLATTPNILALWDYMVQYSRHFPGLLVLAKEPFLVTSHGVPCRHPEGQVMFTVVPDQGDAWKSLWDELMLLERLMRNSVLSVEDAELINSWAPALLNMIEEQTAGMDAYYARYMAHVSLKN